MAGLRCISGREKCQTAGGTFNRARYAYDASTGALATVTDVQNNVFTLAYDRQTRADSVMMPGGIVQRFHYDGAGRLVNDFVFNRNFSIPGHSSYRQPSRNDVGLQLPRRPEARRERRREPRHARGRVLRPRLPRGERLLRAYAGDQRRYRARSSSEGFARDGLANDTTARTAITNASSQTFERTVGRRNTRYQPGTGRQVLVRHLDPADVLLRADSLLYDESGNVIFSWTTFARPGAPRTLDDRAMYYAADGRLRVVDHRTATVNGPTGVWVPVTFDFDEHRYDALGRRVLTRTQRECVINLDYLVCALSTIRRTVWDGSQELMEIQQPGHTSASAAVLENDTAFAPRLPIHHPGSSVGGDPNPFYGRVAYTFGPALDQPMSVTRWSFQADSAG